MLLFVLRDQSESTFQSEPAIAIQVSWDSSFMKEAREAEKNTYDLNTIRLKRHQSETTFQSEPATAIQMSWDSPVHGAGEGKNLILF